jgi:hypothetical protein
MHQATFVLSTGRCGTQWLTEVLRRALGERARVEHEPLHNDYAPRRMLSLADPATVGGRAGRRMLEHAAAIEQDLETRDYIETGHPCWGALPWLLRRFEGRIRIIHLVRHPVPTACSWLSHRAYVPPPIPTLPGKELVLPTDAGVSFAQYHDRWAQCSAFEKCLYYWAEVNGLGLRLEREAGVPWLRVRYEDLFDANHRALSDLMAFVEAPSEAATNANRGERIDQHRFAIESPPDLTAIAKHPIVIELARQLGYEV